MRRIREDLETERDNLYNFRLSILDQLERAARLRSAEGLWKDCGRLLAEKLDMYQVDFLLEMERHYVGAYLNLRGGFEERRFWRPGGLVDILRLIGHYEEELTLGTFAKARDGLRSLLEPDSLSHPRLVVSHYCELIGRPERKEIDAALDKFHSLKDGQERFWIGYWERVNEFLKRDFRARYQSTVKADKYEPEVECVLRGSQPALETPSQPPQSLRVIRALDPFVPDGDAFANFGQYWFVRYEGKVKLFDDTLGMKYIALLLDRPGQVISCRELLTAVRGEHPDAANSHDSKQLNEQGLSTERALDHGQSPDDLAKLEYKKRLKELQAERVQAKQDKDQARLQKINEEFVFIEKELGASVDHTGKPRRISREKENFRKAVGIAISRSEKTIKKDHPSLEEHLTEYIDTGQSCMYHPPPNTQSWYVKT